MWSPRIGNIRLLPELCEEVEVPRDAILDLFQKLR
jgi:hypothetical protein